MLLPYSSITQHVQDFPPTLPSNKFFKIAQLYQNIKIFGTICYTWNSTIWMQMTQPCYYWHFRPSEKVQMDSSMLDKILNGWSIAMSIWFKKKKKNRIRNRGIGLASNPTCTGTLFPWPLELSLICISSLFYVNLIFLFLKKKQNEIERVTKKRVKKKKNYCHNIIKILSQMPTDIFFSSLQTPHLISICLQFSLNLSLSQILFTFLV